MVAAAKALADAARETRVLEIRGGVMQGRTMTAAEVEGLATLPPLEILRGQVLGAIVAPITALAGLVNAPLQNLYGLLDARIEQLQEQGAGSAEPDAAQPASAETPAPEETPTPADATASASESTEEEETS
jgi:large subunit ribosomal protein L10